MTTVIKRAVIREPGYPVGSPAPCYIKCWCGARPRAYTGPVRCDCGTRYTDDGWVVSDDQP